jgi:GT2 family glycosyltransferase
MASAVLFKPRLSVVVPTHDTRSLTLACLASLRSAGAAEAEVIVVDDASRDGTAEAVRERYSTVRVLRNERAESYTRSANRGLGVAAGELLLLLNSDTEVAPGAWEALDSAFRHHRRLGIVGAALRYPDGAPQWSGGRFPSLLWLFVLAAGVAPLLAPLPGARAVRSVSAAGGGPVDWVTGAAMAFRREVWTEVGALDEGFRLYGQDLDFCTRAREAGWEVAVVPDFRVVHHQGATIGRKAGAAGRQSPESLWRDLVRWAWKHRGPGWAKRAAVALRAGGRLRLTGRAVAGLFLSGEARKTWRRDSLAYGRALAAVREGIRVLNDPRHNERPTAPASACGDPKRP